MYLLTVPAIDISRTVLNLPIATLGNSGGNRTQGIRGRFEPSYSQIDIAICGITSLFQKESEVTDLSKWFLDNPNPIGEIWVTCTTITDIGDTASHTILEWKHLARYYKKIKKLFKHNAPFTFRGL